MWASNNLLLYVSLFVGALGVLFQLSALIMCCGAIGRRRKYGNVSTNTRKKSVLELLALNYSKRRSERSTIDFEEHRGVMSKVFTLFLFLFLIGCSIRAVAVLETGDAINSKNSFVTGSNANPSPTPSLP